MLKTGSGGAVTRISNNGGTVKAPYLWEEDGSPANLASANGADMTVTTNTGNGQPHLLLYSTQCTRGWFDTVTAQCSP